jgi:lysophospholipase L1-like esterase
MNTLMKKSTHILCSAFLALVLVVPAMAQEKAKDAKAKKTEAPKAKKAAPNPAMAPIEDKAGLPRVLIIGDSISIGYTLPVRALLEGKANVHRIPTNGGPTKNGTAKIDSWLGKGKWDVIHFNFGLHDAKYMTETTRQVEPDEYEKNLRELVKKMKATGATLIWAATTPVPKGDLNPPRKFEDIPVYNKVAAKIMKEEGVDTDDLYTYIMPTLETHQLPQNVHYTKEGYEQLAKQVASSIEAHLPKK